MSGIEDTAKVPFRDAAVAAAREFWKEGVSESRRGSTAPIAKDSGWNKYGDLRAPDGAVTDWCGMFVAASYYRAGLCAGLRKGFFHVANVEHYFTYSYESRVPRWVWDAAAGDWRSLRDYHAERGSSRVWIDRDVVARADLAALDIRPGDVALIDHEGDGKANHITLVESYDPATGALVTLEGNGRGKVVTALNPDGSVVEGDAKSDAAVRNLRDLADPARRKKIYGVGRLSDVDVEDLAYAHSDRKPAKPPESARVAVASAEPDVPRGLEGTNDGEVIAEDGREGPKKINPRKWNEPPEPVPLWLDPAAEVTEETGPRPAPRGPFVVAAMKACLALGCDPTQAAGVVANSINETGWGRSYRAYNCGGWKITPRYVKGFKTTHPNESPRWWRAPGNRTSGDPPWCYYRAFTSFEAYFEEWIAHFVPRPDGSAPYVGYTRAGELFWNGEDWFPAMIAAGYKGSVTKAKPERSIREHDALVVTALRMWAQSLLALTVDGVWGKVSRATLAEWQRAQGLAETGSLDDATIAALAGDGGVSGGGALESLHAPIDEEWSEWAFEDLAPEAEGAAGEGAHDALDALIEAWRRRSPASRRALALGLIAALGSDIAEEVL